MRRVPRPRVPVALHSHSRAGINTAGITAPSFSPSKAQRPNFVKIKAALRLLAFCAVCASGSAFGQLLYPVAGPASSQTPPQAIPAKLTGAGGISLLLAGETFKGKWTIFRPSPGNIKTPGTPDSYPPQPNLAFAWDEIYGQGYFLGNVLGESIGHATLTGDRKTTLQLEFFDGRCGVAADSKGNIYKMVL